MLYNFGSQYGRYIRVKVIIPIYFGKLIQRFFELIRVNQEVNFLIKVFLTILTTKTIA